MGGKGGSSSGGGVSYKGTHLNQGAGVSGQGSSPFGPARVASPAKEGGTATARGYEGKEMTPASWQSLKESAWAGIKSGVTSPPIGLARFAISEAMNAKDVAIADRIGLDLETTRNIADTSKTKGLLGSANGDDDDDGGWGGLGETDASRDSEGTWA